MRHPIKPSKKRPSYRTPKKTTNIRFFEHIRNIRFSGKWIGVGSIIIAVAIVFSMLLSIIGNLAVIEFILTYTPKQHISGTSVLAFGIDDTKTVQRSDTIMVFHLEPNKKRIGVISIPRDCQVNIPGIGLTKINHAYAYGGAKLLQKTVSNFLGIPIDHYVKINIQGVQEMIDTFGGVPVTVDKDLQYQDTAGNLDINIKKGRQVLDGKNAVNFLRFRKDTQGDIGRINRQQRFLSEFTQKMVRNTNVLEIPLLVKQIRKSIQSNLSTRQLISFSFQAYEALKQQNINSGTIPGRHVRRDGVSYWKPDILAIDPILEKTLFGFTQTRTEQTSTTAQNNDIPSPKRRRLTEKDIGRIDATEKINEKSLNELSNKPRIEVLNGSGKKGIAETAANQLQKLGVKISRFGNAGNFGYEETLIVDWKGNPFVVTALAKALSIDPTNIIVYDRPDKPIDATLVLGNDWQTLQEKSTILQ